jgi:hypothetical protein
MRVRPLRSLATVALAAGLAAAPAAAPASLPQGLLPAAAIAPGMTGTGRTVVLGTAISEFEVRVLGILRNAGPAGDLVLFRASGPAIQSVGGLAAGMSGSPIYLGGRLAGAFSYTFQGADPTVGLFTPIEDMLRDLPPAAPAAGARPRAYAIAPLRVGGRTIRRVVVAWSRLSPQAARAARRPDTLVAVPAVTPLFVSGFSEPAREALARVLAPMGVVPVQGSGAVGLPASLPLVPGSAIGVGLMQGEISAYAIGTLTYRDGSRILAFGHPFTDVGRASYLLTNATIFQTVRGQQQNIKVGAAGALVGTISEDRPAAIGGTIGVLPRVFGVRIRVADADAGTARVFNFQVVNSKELAPALVMLGAQEAIERALNRSGEGTAQVRMVLRGRALDHPVVRENLFYSGNDIAAQALAEVPQAMHLMFDNDFADVGPVDMQMDVRVTGQQETAVMTDVHMPSGPVAPGGRLRVRVTLRPFRGAPQTQDVDLTVPQDFPPGSALLVVRAGGAAAPPALAGAAAQPSQLHGAPRTLTDAFSAFEKGEKNTDVVVELVGGPRPSPAGAPAAVSRASATWTTPWVLRGRFQMPILIQGGR